VSNGQHTMKNCFEPVAGEAANFAPLSELLGKPAEAALPGRRYVGQLSPVAEEFDEALLRRVRTCPVSRPPLPAAIHTMFPPAGDGARQGPPLRRQFDTGVAEPPTIAPRLLVHVGLGLRRLAPLAPRMQVALAVGTAIDDGLDVIAGPRVAGTEPAAGTEPVMQPALFRRVALLVIIRFLASDPSVLASCLFGLPGRWSRSARDMPNVSEAILRRPRPLTGVDLPPERSALIRRS
jgi:hypothetical protein